MHYVLSKPSEAATSDTSLIIFLHGFPDSWYLWSHFLRQPQLRRKATLIAVDLPGYGGSDSLPRYGPDEVLTVLAEFILQMRKKFYNQPLKKRKDSPRVLVVAHDWGALLAFRLASEAPELADRFILSNAVYPPLILANINGRLAAAKRMLHSWTQNRRNLRLITHAFSNVKPLLAQIGNSGYVFTFRLPTSFAWMLGSLGDFFFLRLLNAFALGAKDPTAPVDTPQAFELLASSVGPGHKECDADIDYKYGESVRRRAVTGGWTDKIGLYREGCFGQKWEKPVELIVTLAELSSSGRRDSLDLLRPEGAIQAPVTLIWGEDDVAIENCLALDGIRDYFNHGSQLVKVKRCGHWTPLERNAVPIFEAILHWALDDRTTKLSDALGDDYPMANITIEK